MLAPSIDIIANEFSPCTLFPTSCLQYLARLKASKQETAALRADPEATLCDHRPLFLNLGD